MYEASDRVGGRMFSERDHRGGGQTTEYGGEFIDTGHTAMLDLCGRFGLPLVDVLETAPKGARDVLHSDGRYRSYAQFVADFGPVYKALRADVDAAGAVVPKWDAATPAGVALSRLSVAEWISTRVPDGYSTWLGGFLDEAYTVEYGTEAADQTAVDLVYLLGDQADPANPTVWGPSDERLRVQGGNRQVPEAVAASLPSGSIEHGRRLKALARNNDGSQTLTFDIGGRTRTVRADHTILTVPIAVLKRIDHSRAGFDRRMRGAISALGMGACAKLHVQVSSRVWQGHGRWPDVSTGSAFSDNGFQQVWDATPGRPGEQGIAIQYGGRDGARAFRPRAPFLTNADAYVRAAAGRKTAEIDRVLPGVRRVVTGQATLAAWHLNPNSHGAYSCYPVDYCHRFAGYEGVRQGTVHLAGEHTSVDSQGYMNDGAESGSRAAREVLADLRTK